MPGPLLPIIGAAARFLLSNGSRAAIAKYGRKAVEIAEKEIRKRNWQMDEMAGRANTKAGADRSTLLSAKSKRASDPGYWGPMSGRAERLSKAEKRALEGSDLLRPPKEDVPLKFAEGGMIADDTDAGMEVLLEQERIQRDYDDEIARGTIGGGIRGLMANLMDWTVGEEFAAGSLRAGMANSPVVPPDIGDIEGQLEGMPRAFDIPPELEVMMAVIPGGGGKGKGIGGITDLFKSMGKNLDPEDGRTLDKLSNKPKTPLRSAFTEAENEQSKIREVEDIVSRVNSEIKNRFGVDIENLSDFDRRRLTKNWGKDSKPKYNMEDLRPEKGGPDDFGLSDEQLRSMEDMGWDVDPATRKKMELEDIEGMSELEYKRGVKDAKNTRDLPATKFDKENSPPSLKAVEGSGRRPTSTPLDRLRYRRDSLKGQLEKEGDEMTRATKQKMIRDLKEINRQLRGLDPDLMAAGGSLMYKKGYYGKSYK